MHFLKNATAFTVILSAHKSIFKVLNAEWEIEPTQAAYWYFIDVEIFKEEI